MYIFLTHIKVRDVQIFERGTVKDYSDEVVDGLTFEPVIVDAKRAQFLARFKTTEQR